MRAQPFHRRILPWIFTIVFLGVAPALVFYTAGYRWNPKKGMIERNGTVIIDSTPTGASISIDDRPIANTTPVTIQNMAPGTHRFTVSKAGYSTWSKSFDVIPEHVVFANDIRLWKQSSPVLVFKTSVGSISLSTDDRHLLFLSSTTPTEAVVFDTRGTLQTKLTTPDMDVQEISWSDNGRYALVEGKTASWLIDINGRQQTLPLPDERYRWEGTKLVGNDNGSLLTIALGDFSLSQAPRISDRVDQLGQNALITPTGTQSLAFVGSSAPTEGFILPSKDWMLWSSPSGFVILRSGSDWLSLIKDGNGIQYRTAQSDRLRQDPSTKKPHELLVHDTELWIWDPLIDPELVIRSSDRIVDAAWHGKGKDVFFATEQDVYALNLDVRDGRMKTPLAHFDHIYGLTQANTMLYILATQNGTTGLYSLVAE